MSTSFRRSTTHKSNYLDKRTFARYLRKNATPPERMLWAELRNSRLGVKFRRQSLILGWIVDFYCPSHKLVVEVDSSFHDPVKDEIRDNAMIAKGLFILRVQAKQVMTDMDTVLKQIVGSIK